MSCNLGRVRILVQVDVGFGDHVRAKEEELSTLLALPQPVFRMYPKASVIAEKTEAMIQLGAFNSRMKDFYDIAVLADEFAFAGAEVSAALEATFIRRETPLPAQGLNPLFAEMSQSAEKERQWAGFLRKSFARRAWTFEEVLARVLAFIDPPLGAAAAGDSFDRYWSPGGAWQLEGESEAT